MRKLEEYLRPEVIQEVARLDLKARFIVEGFISGLHDSPYYGFSSEFSEHRKYTAGDDPRHIDWKVYARTDKFYIKRFEAETNLNCHVLLDTSESMTYAYEGSLTKLEYCTYMAAALGYLMINQQDNVGLITFDDEVTNVAPARCKRSHLISILAVLGGSLRHRPSRLARCLHRAADAIRSRGLVVVFSDLVPGQQEEQHDVIEGLRHLSYRGHDVVCFQVLDPAEVELPFDGPTRFVDVESEETVQADPRAVRNTYRREIQQFIGRYRDGCRDADMDFTQVVTSRPFDQVLLSFLRARQKKF